MSAYFRPEAVVFKLGSSNGTIGVAFGATGVAGSTGVTGSTG
jgi:hypothetical protein